MYSEVQEPMMDAAQETLQQQLQNNPFAALFNSQDSTLLFST
jgi:ubiquilin